LIFIKRTIGFQTFKLPAKKKLQIYAKLIVFIQNYAEFRVRFLKFGMEFLDRYYWSKFISRTRTHLIRTQINFIAEIKKGNQLK